MTAPNVTEPATFDGPLTISAGGTYTGLARRATGTQNAISITTSAPVIIENSWIEHERGEGINSTFVNADVELRNSVIKANHPGAAGTFKGYSAAIQGADRLIVENCWIEGGGGFWNYQFNGAAAGPLTFRYNQFRNIDGRHSDGAGGYVSNAGAALTDWNIVTAIQMPSSPGLQACEIAWNEIVNLPYQSGVQDNINVYESSGTVANPIDIHHNMVWGGYPAHPDNDYFGGGILGGDGVDNEIVKNVTVRDNRCAGTVNYGVGVAQGQDVTLQNNRTVGSGRNEAGDIYAAANNGAYIWNAVYDGHPLQPNFGPCQSINNWSRWWRADEVIRVDYYMPDCTGTCDQISGTPAGIVDWVDERAEWQAWFNTDRPAAGVTVGPSGW